MNNENLNKAIELFNSKKYNKSLLVLKDLLSKDSKNKEALYYSCLIYRNLEKWSKSKTAANKYLKNHGSNGKIFEVLGDISFFEGNYKKAHKYYLKAKKYSNNKIEKEKIIKKSQKTIKKYNEVKNHIKVALIVAEGTDNFTDDIVKGLSDYFWVRKVIIPRRQLRIYRLLYKIAKNKKQWLSKIIYNFIPATLKNAISWSDVVWVEWLSEIAVTASYLKKKNKKLFVRLHSYEAFEDYPRLLNWNNTDGIVFVSNFMKEVLEKRGINIKIKTKTIYNGINIKKIKFSNRGVGYNIGLVAYLHPQKNIHLALEILYRLIKKDSNYKLHIAGNFTNIKYQRYIEHLVKIMNLKDNVIFYGYVNDIEKWWEDKNYVLSASIHEGHPYNIIESMAKGIKPIIHSFNGATELYDKEFLFCCVDEAVEKIINGKYDSKYYREYIINKGWTVEKQIEEFKNFIEEL